MPTAPMDALSLLKADHREVEALFETFESARGASKQAKVVRQICDALTVHAQIEDEIFYPALRAHVDDDDIDEAYVEHDCAKLLIAELRAAEPNEDFYKAKVMVLKEQIEHHVREEERARDSLFAQAKAEGVPLDEIGVALAQRKSELMVGIKAGGETLPQLATMSAIQI